MAKNVGKISKRTVDAAHWKPNPKQAKPKANPTFLWDETLKGFGLQILPTGIKSYIFQYRTAQGRSRRITIAKVGAVTPEQARDIAEDHAATVRIGGDPLADKRTAREAPTVGEILDLYVASEKFKEKAPATQSNDRARINRHLKPLLGRQHIHTLTVEDIRRVMRSIRDGKTAITVKTDKPRGRSRVRGGEMAARDSIGLLRTALNWARAENLITKNPAADVKLGASRQRETVITEPEEYQRLFEALNKLESELTISGPTADVFRMLAMTGARKSEIAACRWRHVDLEKGEIILPPDAHKTGRATGKPRVITLPAAAQEIIARQTEGQPDELVFKAARGSNPIALQRPWVLVRTAAKLPPALGIHGLRHSLATMLAVSGAQAAEIMVAVGHHQMSTTARYLHFAQNARAALAERAAAPALAGLAAAAGKNHADVVPLRRKDGR